MNINESIIHQQAIFTIEKFIVLLQPKSKTDIESAITAIIDSATAALISLIGWQDCNDYLQQIIDNNIIEQSGDIPIKINNVAKTLH